MKVNIRVFQEVLVILAWIFYGHLNMTPDSYKLKNRIIVPTLCPNFQTALLKVDRTEPMVETARYLLSQS